jgi:hypothetical protein
MNNTKSNGANNSNQTPQEPVNHSGKWGRFLDLLVAVLTLDIPRMGGKLVLSALIRRLGNRDPQDKTGLRATLQTTTTLENIQTRANCGDQLAYAELLYLATTATQTLAQVTADHPELAAPFVRVNPTWPILAIFSKSVERDMPVNRLEELRFGEKAREIGVRKFKNKLGLLALLLGIYAYLKNIVEGNSLCEHAPKGDKNTKTEWKKQACPTLNEAFPNLADLPFDEAKQIRTHRRETRENKEAKVDGLIRYQIKLRYLQFAKFTQALLSIANPSTDAGAKKDSQ